MEYLTEESLAEVLKKIFPLETFIHDKMVPYSNTKTRPDYRCEKLKLIIEFDGDQHYRNVKKIKNEIKKDQIYQQLGYTVVRIPYFVQISTLTIQKLFSMKLIYQQTYPHGFFSKTVVMPCDFCELGIIKFELDLKKFSYIKKEIISSLNKKVAEFGDKELVVPPSLEYLLNQ